MSTWRERERYLKAMYEQWVNSILEHPDLSLDEQGEYADKEIAFGWAAWQEAKGLND